MAKSYADEFIRNVLTSGQNEQQAVADTLAKSSGKVRKGGGGNRIVDIALAGGTKTALPSMRKGSDAPPSLHLRRYFAPPERPGSRVVITFATAGVDLDAAAFRALVARTAKKTGMDGPPAVEATVRGLINTSIRRQRTLEANQEVRFTNLTPDGIVHGVSRGADEGRVDDYHAVSPPMEPSAPIRERLPSRAGDEPSRRVPLAKTAEDRAAIQRRISADIRQKEQRDAAAQKKGRGARGPGRGLDMGDG